MTRLIAALSIMLALIAPHAVGAIGVADPQVHAPGQPHQHHGPAGDLHGDDPVEFAHCCDAIIGHCTVAVLEHEALHADTTLANLSFLRPARGDRRGGLIPAREPPPPRV